VNVALQLGPRTNLLLAALYGGDGVEDGVDGGVEGQDEHCDPRRHLGIDPRPAQRRKPDQNDGHLWRSTGFIDINAK
jgi:hypothetical protein